MKPRPRTDFHASPLAVLQWAFSSAVCSLLLLTSMSTTGAPAPPGILPIVPRPVETRIIAGAPFAVTPSTGIVGAWELHQPAAPAFDALRRATAQPLSTHVAARNRNAIVLRLDPGLFPDLPDWQRDEGYHLSVSSTRVELSARSSHGLFNGLQTLAQIAMPAKRRTSNIPACEVTDYPRFQWRGLLLDPARHFLPPEFVKKFIAVMASYKFNRLQLHLTDDQGWRIQIRKYPRLTSIGSIRKESPKPGNREHGDGQVYGPFSYTQKQIRELVAWAEARHVTLVPEIEIPGHFGAALAAHPEFSCTGGPFEVNTRWGIRPDILCPGNDAAIAFVKDVLDEVCDLFPGKFIHIGGDEAPRERWQACPKCQARMKAQGLNREAQLQTWLNHQLEAFLATRGRRMIGWDEILEGGLTPGAIVMSWRGSQGGIDAAKADHDVIMSPTTHCYFDYAQAESLNEPECIGGFVSLEKVYSFQPEPSELAEPQRRHILGAQGNIWGEFIWDGNGVEYFAFPRALALAEVAWSPSTGRTFEAFIPRLNSQYVLLDRRQVRYRKPDAETTRHRAENEPGSGK